MNIVYDIEKGTKENAKISYEEIFLIEEAHSNIKVKDENWNEISIVYEILILLLNNYFSSVILNKLFTKKFMYTFLLNINSFDSEERLIVKMVIFKLYCASVELRKILLEIIEEFILDFNSNREYQITGLVECFDILSKSNY